MKLKHLLIILLPFFLSACSSQSFELTGKLKNSQEQMVYLIRFTLEGMHPSVVDSVKIDESGEFKMSPTIKETELFCLKVRGIKSRDFVLFFFEPNQKVTVTADVKDFNNSYTVEGSPDSKLYWEFARKQSLYLKKKDGLLNTVFEEKDAIVRDKASDDLTVVTTEYYNYLITFLKTNSSSLVSPFVFLELEHLRNGINDPELLVIISKIDSDISKKYPNTPWVKLTHSVLEKFKRSSKNKNT